MVISLLSAPRILKCSLLLCESVAFSGSEDSVRGMAKQ